MQLVRKSGLALSIAWLAIGVVGAGAFTLVVAKVRVAPTSGLQGRTFLVQGTFQASCANQPPPYDFTFYWDKGTNKPFWTKAGVTCDPRSSQYDTGNSPPVLPPGGQNAPGTHLILVTVTYPGVGPIGAGRTTYTIIGSPSPRPSAPPTRRPAPSPKPSPSPCYAEGHTSACASPSKPKCISTAAAIWPGAPGGGVPPLMLVLGFALFGAMLVVAPRLKGRRLSKSSALLVVLITSSCTPTFGKPSVSTSTPAASGRAIVGFESTPDCRGYWFAASDGGIFPFGGAGGFGSTGGIKLNKPIVGVEATPDGRGYWLVASDGGIFPFGNAAGFGSTGSVKLNKPIVAMENTADGAGYWLVAADGGIFPFGNAAGYGSTGSIKLNKPIVGMEATPGGAGYWLVAADGGIFPFGNAVGYGSTGSIHLNKPIVGMEATPDGAGYWLVASDGGIFPFGNALGYGSTGSVHLTSPIVGMEGTPDGHGYWLFAADGGAFPFGDAPGYGSPAGHT